MKALGSTEEVHFELPGLSPEGGGGIPGGTVKCVDIGRNIGGEGDHLSGTDAEMRKRGEQTGLDTLVVHALNGEH